MSAALARMGRVSWLFVVLLACAVAVLIGAEWPRLAGRAGGLRPRERRRSRRKASLTLIRSEADDTAADDFAASVERDLSRLPTIEERDRRRN